MPNPRGERVMGWGHLFKPPWLMGSAFWVSQMGYVGHDGLAKRLIWPIWVK